MPRLDAMSQPIDPEVTTELPPADLQEVAVDETPDEQRPQPLEADPADAAEQRAEVTVDDENDDDF
jgi:hypothetical protein